MKGGGENPNAKKREAIVHLEASLGLITCRHFSLGLLNDKEGRVNKRLMMPKRKEEPQNNKHLLDFVSEL